MKFLAPAVGEQPQWKLCYRASSHGWAASTFHSMCDGKPNTVTIIKVWEYVFGGYTDIPWGKLLISSIQIVQSDTACITTLLAPSLDANEDGLEIFFDGTC